MSNVRSSIISVLSEKIKTVETSMSILDCILSDKNNCITLCYTKLNEMLDASKQLTPLNTIDEMLKVIESLTLLEIVELDFYITEKLKESEKIKEKMKIETPEQRENRRLNHWIIKSVILGFIAISVIITAGILFDSIINPDDDNLKILLNIFNSYKEIAAIAIGGK